MKTLLIVIVMLFGQRGSATTTYEHNFRSEAACLEAARMLERREDVESRYGKGWGSIMVQADCVEP